ncbi:hypothetical protein K0M31_018609 [Melipona bicolor]|uniref:Uncharacterized protein n=1 Tax=Melipona bicolor TaxID=60889 RepID=A0AA40KRV2_9HYME|nr:hypothetical protein K0M31_018609 [Melipona bicolor]
MNVDEEIHIGNSYLLVITTHLHFSFRSDTWRRKEQRENHCVTGERRVGNLGNAGGDTGSKANEEDGENEERGQKEQEQRRDKSRRGKRPVEFLRRTKEKLKIQE